MAQAVLVALATTAVVTGCSYLLPENYAATGVGFGFLAATYVVALRRDDPDDARTTAWRSAACSSREPLDRRRLLARRAPAPCSGRSALALVVLPPFWVGLPALVEAARQPFRRPRRVRSLPCPELGASEHVLGQLLVIALPEEAFYRGTCRPRSTSVGDRAGACSARWVGPGLLLTSALFALGHLLTEVHPNRLAVFFPSLVFGWLRARTGGIGAPLAFHALCNLFASYLGRSYGFGE